MGSWNSGVVLTVIDKWTIGALASNIWSVAGSGNNDINLFTFQYFVNYNLDGGWYLITAPINTANWEADSNNRWTIPLPSLSKMWLKVINLEQSLFSTLQESIGSLTPKEEKLIKILDFAQVERFVSPVQITNPPKDREEMARAFVAKQVYNFQTTSALIDRLKIDRTLRLLCGWRHCNKIPSESKFSRVFKEFSQQRIATKAHDVFIENYLSATLFFYSSIDSTAIELREKAVKPEKEIKPKRRQGRPKKGEELPPKKPSILQQQENMNEADEMLSIISTESNTSIKQNSKGNRHRWTGGGKLHLSVVDGDIPITAIYSSASVHDSSLALPLIKLSSQKVNYLYDLADAAYDNKIIKSYSQKQNHRPIIDINPKNSKKLKAQIALAKSEKKTLEPLRFYNDSDDLHYNQRTSVERVNAYFKDSYVCSKIYYQGGSKGSFCISLCCVVCLHHAVFEADYLVFFKKIANNSIYNNSNHKTRTKNRIFNSF